MQTERQATARSEGSRVSRNGDDLDRLIDDYVSNRVDRRGFLQRSFALGLSVSAAGSLLAACGGGDEEEGADTAPAEKVSTALLRVHLDEDIENLDPAIQPGHADGNVATNIFQNLVSFKPGTYEPVNELAEKWQGSEDGLRWDFTLKQGVQFHKGHGEMTADDVKFSFERVAGLTKPKLESPYASDWAALKVVEVKDKYSGTVVLKEPYAPLMTTTIPQQAGEIVSKKAVEELGDKFGTNPVGTGPYEFVEWKRKQRISLKRFAENEAVVDFAEPPPWEAIDFVVIGEDNPTLIALETGELDFAVLPTAAIDRIEEGGQFDVTNKTTLNYNWIGMNVLHENLKDKNVRLAVRYGVDVPSILEGAFDGRWEQATAILPPGMPIGYWEEAPKYERDVEQAKQYLADAGAEGLKLVMAVSADEPGAETVAEIVQANLNEVGFEIEVQVQEGGVFGQATKEGNAQRQLFYTGFTTNPDPAWSTVWFTCDQVNIWNWMSWCNEEYSRLDKEAARTTEEDARHEMYIQMQQIMDEDVPAVWVAWPTDFFATKKGIKPSLAPDGDYDAWSFTTA
jgi:peptide/nickel transport system substrate-binding protein